jgi:citrate lyase synthetase
MPQLLEPKKKFGRKRFVGETIHLGVVRKNDYVDVVVTFPVYLQKKDIDECHQILDAYLAGKYGRKNNP